MNSHGAIVPGYSSQQREVFDILASIVLFPFRLLGKIVGIFVGGIIMAGGLSVLALVYLFPIIVLAALIAFFLKVF